MFFFVSEWRRRETANVLNRFVSCFLFLVFWLSFVAALRWTRYISNSRYTVFLSENERSFLYTRFINGIWYIICVYVNPPTTINLNVSLHFVHFIKTLKICFQSMHGIVFKTHDVVLLPRYHLYNEATMTERVTYWTSTPRVHMGLSLEWAGFALEITTLVAIC